MKIYLLKIIYKTTHQQQKLKTETYVCFNHK